MEYSQLTPQQTQDALNSGVIKQLDPLGDNVGIITQPPAYYKDDYPSIYYMKSVSYIILDVLGANKVDNFVAYLFSPVKKDAVTVTAGLMDLGLTLSKSEAGPTPTALDGSISMTRYGLKDYIIHPEVPEPSGPLRLKTGQEYRTARSEANAANRALHQNNPHLAGMDIHEIKPVVWSGSPTDLNNKVPLSRADHVPFTNWWSALQKEMEPYMQFLEQNK